MTAVATLDHPTAFVVEDPAPAQDAAAHAAACPACEGALAPDWAHCPACGERRQAGRLTLGDLWRDFVARTFQLERGFFRTFVDLTLRPGPACRAYVEGVRRPYVAPLAYFFLATAFGLLLYTTFQADALRVEMRANLEAQAQSYAGSPAAAVFSPDALDRVTALTLASLELTYAYQTLLSSLLAAAILRALFRRRGYNLAEAGVFALFTSAQFVLFSAVAMLLLKPYVAMNAWMYGVLAAQALYVGFAAAPFFGTGRVRGVAGAALASVVSLFVVSGGQGVAIWTYVLLT